MTQRSLADRLHSIAIQLLRWARTEDVATGLSAARLSALSVLVYGGPRTVTELASAEQVATPTMTRLLQGLEADGYVTRRRDRTDARIVRIKATAKGRRALDAGRRARLRRIDDVLRELDADSATDLAAAVAALETALARAVERSRT